ncbi:MAG TPA: hypothetical protein VN704_00225 [Verrucomicrobiae bacterium]|nr:hypothetical protein [Verrucomicrobiae bacterium]
MFEQSIIAVSQLVDENINHECICQDNSNNNASIKKNISKANN